MFADFLRNKIKNTMEVAIQEENLKLKYDELINAITKVSNWIKINLSEKERIAVFLPRSIQQVTVMLGIFDAHRFKLVGNLYVWTSINS